MLTSALPGKDRDESEALGDDGTLTLALSCFAGERTSFNERKKIMALPFRFAHNCAHRDPIDEVFRREVGLSDFGVQLSPFD
jgi:hypothetical protein